MEVNHIPSLRLDSGFYIGKGPTPYNNMKATEAFVFGNCIGEDDSWKSRKDIVSRKVTKYEMIDNKYVCPMCITCENIAQNDFWRY